MAVAYTIAPVAAIIAAYIAVEQWAFKPAQTTMPSRWRQPRLYVDTGARSVCLRAPRFGCTSPAPVDTGAFPPRHAVTG